MEFYVEDLDGESSHLPSVQNPYLYKSFRRRWGNNGSVFVKLAFAEHVLTDGNFLFDSSKRSLQAMRHVIAQVLFDNRDKNLVSAPKPNQRRVIKPK